MQVEYMNSPTKSDEDKKEYRVIKLQNGLTATLISYPNNDSDEDKTTKRNKSASQFGKMAACALCVKVGSFSDPPEAQGLAHVLEHMVYLGSSKYPQKNEFDTFLTSHGGSGNAFTQSERTIFFFMIPDPHFLEALDRFSQFLIDPLLNSDSIDKECEILESEFQLHFSDDSHKKDRLISLSLKENHPGKQFSQGNNESLKTLGSVGLQSKLQNFRSRYYSAHQMTLAIQACQPLDIIEGYVKDYFTNIPTNDLPALNYPEFSGVSSFDLDTFHKIYKFKPTEKSFMLQLSWPRPPNFCSYRSKPAYYVSWLVGYEGSGSLLSFLRHKLWATDLSAGTDPSNSIFSLFQITIHLTDQGSHHIPEICDAVFSFLNLLKGANPSRRIFEEIQHIEDVCFRFKSEESPMNNVGCIASYMTLFPPEDYLTGSELLFEYDPREIMKVLSDLTPSNVNLMIFDPKSEEEQFEREEYWFKIKYNVEDIPSRWVEQWKVIKPFAEFKLPDPNLFLTTDFSLVRLPERVPAYPEKIYEDSLIKVWYKPDDIFRGLKSFYSLSLKTYMMNTSPYNSAMGDMFNVIMQHMMKDEVYAATCTGLEHNLCTSDRGILILMNGWSQKLPLLLDHITKCYTNFCNTITEDVFSMGKVEELRWYHTILLDPEELMRELKQMILQTNHWSKTTKWAALKEVTYERFLCFVNHIWDNLEINFLAQGNVSAEHAVQHGLKCAQILNCKSAITETGFWTRICQIPLGEHCCRVGSLDPSNPNSVVENYYQTEDTSLKNKIIIEILTTIMEQPLFNEMRTNQQLGYSVSCDLANNYGIYGFSIKVSFQNNKFSSSFIDERIEAFILSFKDTLKKMSLQEFAKVKKTLVGLKEVEDYNLEEEFARNFLEVELGRFAFDRLLKDVEVISEISLDEVETWFDDHTMNGIKCRKISFQIVGNSGGEEDENSDDVKITFMRDTKLEKSSDYFITDIDKFKTSLMLYPVSHTSYYK